MKLLLTSMFSKTGDALLDLVDKDPGQCEVAFITTAADPYTEKAWMYIDRDKLLEMGFDVKDMDLKLENVSSLKSKLNNVDIIFVAGGNTTYLLAKARESGFINLLPELLNNGKIYVGSSAGSIIVGPSVEPYKDDELAELPNDFKIDSFDGAYVIKYVVLPHYGQEKYAKENKHSIEKYGGKYNIKTLTDQQALIINGDKEKMIQI